MTALAKITDFRAAIGSEATDADALVTRYLEVASQTAADLLGVPTLLREVDAVLYPYAPDAPRGKTRNLHLDRGPIESVSEVKQRYPLSEDWADVDALVEDTDFLVDPRKARLERINAVWYVPRRAFVKVTATVGYYDPSQPAPASGSFAPPATLQQGVLEQAQWLWRRADKIGTTGITLGQGGAVDLKDQEIVPSLRNAVMSLPFRRLI